MHIGPPMRIVSDGPSMYAPQLSCSTKSPTTMNDISIARLRELLAEERYQKGAAQSEEDDGLFAGPIESVDLNDSRLRVNVSSQLKRASGGWAIHTARKNPLCQTAIDGILGLHLEEDGVIHYTIQMIGRVRIYPAEHPDAQSILVYGT